MRMSSMGRRRVARALAALLAVVCLHGSASAEGAPKKPFRAVTTFTVIQDIAQNVAGDRAIVDSITRPVPRFMTTSRRHSIS